MWKICCVLLALAGPALSGAAETRAVPSGAREVGGILPFPWPPTLPNNMYLPFVPQLVVPIQKNKIVLVLMEVHLDGIHTCDFKKSPVSAFNCTLITLRTEFKASGGVFDLPIVAVNGTIAVDISLYADLIYVIFGSKLPVIFNELKFDIDGLNPGSDMKYLANSLVNNLKLDFEQAIQIILKKLVHPHVSDACGAKNLEALSVADNSRWGEDVDVLEEEEMQVPAPADSSSPGTEAEESLETENRKTSAIGTASSPETEAEGSLETEKRKTSATGTASSSVTEGEEYLETEKPSATAEGEAAASLSLEETRRCVEGVLGEQWAEWQDRHRDQSPSDSLLEVSTTLASGLEALFKLYMPEL